MTGHAMAGNSQGAIMRTPRVYWWVIALLGVVLIGPVWVGFGVKSLLDSRHFLATAAAADGVVVDDFVVKEGYQYGAFPRSYPVVQFVTDRGEVVRFEAGRSSAPPDFRVGGSIKVLYNPANPQHVRFDTGWNRWGRSIIRTAGGLSYVALLTIGYLYLVSSNRKPVADRSHVRSSR